MIDDKAFYEALLPFADEGAQKAAIEARMQTASNTQAATLLGKSRRSVDKAIKRVQVKASSKGVDPEHGLNRPGGHSFALKKHSDFVNEETGELSRRWYIYEQDKLQAYEAWKTAIDEVVENMPLIPSIKKSKKNYDADLLTCYTITDFHLGMYSWSAETGDDWDVEIADKVLINAVTHMMQGSPDSEMGLLNIQGDFLHWDGLEAVTPTNRHVLDADTRFPKLCMLAISVLIKVVGMLLKKHKTVRVIIVEGNHDLAGSVWLMAALLHVYQSNSRVTVDDTAFPFYAYLHGEIMIGFHHGHKVKNSSLPALFASEPRYREMWGKAKYTFIHTGHYHHAEQDVSEGGGAIVERHPTLSGRDAHAARGGYVSWRAAKAITYHKTKGEWLRVVAIPQLEAA
jgi:hypothetical protein